MIGIDTFTWRKLINLRDILKKSIVNDIIDQLNLFVTVEGKIEFEYRFPDDLYILNKIAVLPVLNSEKYHNYLKKGFDRTDASLLEYADKMKYRIITEDHPMLAEGTTAKKNIIQLIDFFKELYLNDKFLTKKEINQIIKIFRKWNNVTKKKENQIYKILK